MFARRNKFDLVVYYDARTDYEPLVLRPTEESQTMLKNLHELLRDDSSKPLQNSPVLLNGGLDASIDFVGLPAADDQ